MRQGFLAWGALGSSRWLVAWVACLMAACGELPASKSRKQSADSSTKNAGASNDGAAAASKNDDEDEDDEEDDKDSVEELQNDVAKTKLEDEIARLEMGHAQRREEWAVREARNDVEKAEKELHQFNSAERPQRLAAMVLSLDRSRDYTFQAQKELEELEAMYAAEDFADMTKELVLHRGRKQLEFAQRALAQEEAEQTKTRELELPLEAREKERAVEQAKHALTEAEENLALGTIQRRLRALETARAMRDAQRDLDKAMAKSAKEKAGKSGDKGTGTK